MAAAVAFLTIGCNQPQGLTEEDVRRIVQEDASPKSEQEPTALSVPNDELCPSGVGGGDSDSLRVNLIEISGSGTEVKRFYLPQGYWRVDICVSGNEICTFGSCAATRFVAQMESVGQHEPPYVLLANTTARFWQGGQSLSSGFTGRVSSGSRLIPGSQVLSVTAEGDWILFFVRL